MDNKVLEFKCVKSLSDLGKQLLIIMDDMFYDSENARDALEDSIDNFKISDQEKELLSCIIDQGFSMSPNKKMWARKKILDITNDKIRDLQFEFNKINKI